MHAGRGASGALEIAFDPFGSWVASGRPQWLAMSLRAMRGSLSQTPLALLLTEC